MIDQRFPRLAQFDVGVADLLVEDAQRLAVDDRLANLVGSAAQGAQQLAPYRHDGVLPQARAFR